MGRTRTLISISDWDMRWQHVFRYQTPVPLPRGTTVTMRYRYDNSPGNPRNPAVPPVRVPWGQQSTEEMGDFWLQVMPKNPAERQLLDQTFRAKWMADDVVGLESLIRREPNRTALRDDIGVLYMELDRPADAIPHFEATLKLKPDSASAHFNYGTALAGAGRHDDAVAEFQRALQLRPDYAIAHNNLGSALLQLGRPQAALASFREAARIDPGLGEAHLNAGVIARVLGDTPEAIARFRRALELNPDWVTAMANLASLYAASPDASVRNPLEACTAGRASRHAHGPARCEHARRRRGRARLCRRLRSRHGRGRRSARAESPRRAGRHDSAPSGLVQEAPGVCVW